MKLYMFGLLIAVSSCGAPISPPVINQQSCSVDNLYFGFTNNVYHHLQPEDDGRPRLVSFGDSITQGIYRCYESPSHYEFPALVAEALNRQNVNHGVGATIFTEGYGEYGDIMSFDFRATDIVIIMTTHNDLCKYGNDVTHLLDVQNKLTAAIDKITSTGASVYIGTPLNIACLSNVQLYVDTIKNTIAALNNPKAIVVDANSLFQVRQEVLGSDHTHPNPQGDKELADIFINSI